MSTAIEYQRTILADTLRNDAFAKALEKVVRPGATVIDIGSGSGFLSFLARKFGAKHSILIEQEHEFYTLSKGIAKDNAITGCTFLCSSSFDVQKNIKGDIVIAETLGNFAYEENIIETLRDARRFLAPGGTMIPQSLTQWVAPVVAASHGAEIRSWEKIGFDIDWRAGTARSANNMYVRSISVGDLLSQDSARKWDHVEFAKGELASVRRGGAQWSICGDATIHGFAVWWEATLIPGVTLSTSPFSPQTHWKQIFLPLLTPLTTQKGDTLEIQIASDSKKIDGITVSWDARVIGPDGREKYRQRMDMANG